jgi:plastocyanin domain-containing protein
MLGLSKRERGANSGDGTTPQQVRVLVAGGYAPSTIRAEAGVPLQLVFRREESLPCSAVVFPAFGKSAILPKGKDVLLELAPEEPGEYEFTCAMGMLHGRLVVTPRGSAS